MALTRDFKNTVKARAERDPEFRVALLEEAVEALLHGDTETGRALLRDYINATVGFVQLAEDLGEGAPKSLMRMLSKSGNPRMENLFAILVRLQQREGISLDIVPKPLTERKQTADPADEAQRAAKRRASRRPQRSAPSRRR